MFWAQTDIALLIPLFVIEAQRIAASLRLVGSEPNGRGCRRVSPHQHGKRPQPQDRLAMSKTSWSLHLTPARPSRFDPKRGHAGRPSTVNVCPFVPDLANLVPFDFGPSGPGLTKLLLSLVACP